MPLYALAAPGQTDGQCSDPCSSAREASLDQSPWLPSSGGRACGSGCFGLSRRCKRNPWEAEESGGWLGSDHQPASLQAADGVTSLHLSPTDLPFSNPG